MTARSTFPRSLDQGFPDRSIKIFPAARSSSAQPVVSHAEDTDIVEIQTRR
jgi:hypothetical protein